MDINVNTGSESNLDYWLQLGADDFEGAWDEVIRYSTQRLLQLTRRMLHNYARIRNWEDSDDVFQQAVMRLFKSLKSVKPDSKPRFFGLAATQIRRTLLDLARKYQDVPGVGNADLQNAPSDESQCPRSLSEWSDFHECIDQLPNECREVIELIWYGGHEQKAIAEMLGLSVPTIQRRWYRAQILLYKALHQSQPKT